MSDALPHSPRRRAERLQRLALTGLGVNVALAAAKLAAGVLGSSFALVADAVESLVDIVGSVVIWGGLRLGAAPPDDEHPFGHGGAEALAGLAVASIVVVVGVWVGYEAVLQIVEPHDSPAAWTLVVLVVVVVVKETLARVTAAAAKREGSGASAVDAGHHRADAITSAAAFVGISVALLGPRVWGPDPRWATADDWAALLAAVIIVINGVRLARLPLAELMDEQPRDVLERARGVARGVPGVLGIEKARATTRGSRCWLELHVEVDGSMPVREGHAIGGRVRAAVRADNPRVADVHVHVEPAPARRPESISDQSDGGAARSGPPA